MPDINYVETDDFRTLGGQSPGPNQETIFKHAEFDTRSYELVLSESPKYQTNRLALVLVTPALNTKSVIERQANKFSSVVAIREYANS